MNYLNRILSRLKNGDKKKLIENTAIIAIIGIILLIAGGTLFNGSGNSGKNAAQVQTPTANTTAAAQTDAIEEKLRRILGQIKGVGRVDVVVTYSTSGESVPAYDTRKNDSATTEKDSSGGTRSINQKNDESSVVFEDGQNGAKKPVILKEELPAIKGVVVAAEGGANPEVKEKITRAVQVLTDIPIHKIQVVQRK